MARAQRGLHGEAARVADRVRAVLGAADSDGAPSRFRVDPGRRSVLVVGLVVVLAAVLTGIWVVSSRPRTMPVSAAAPEVSTAPLLGASARPSSSTTSSVPSPGASTSASPSTSATVVVDVAGKVARPGVYRLPSGSRVDDALKAAGGARRGVDLGTLNLAAVLVDGQQIPVGRPGAVTGQVAPGAPAGASSAVSGAGGLINLNMATAEQLDDLPGIGPALSQRILDYRTEHGSFNAVDQLDDVSGIGPAIFARLKALVTV